MGCLLHDKRSVCINLRCLSARLSPEWGLIRLQRERKDPWMKGRESTETMLEIYDHAHDRVVIASRWLDHSYLKGPLMTELPAVLRTVNRVDMIRDSYVAPSFYWE